MTFASYLAASTLAGAVLGSVLGSAGTFMFSGVDGWILVGILLVAVMIGLGVDRGVARFSLPSVSRQVSEEWLREYRGWVYGVGFGFQLGIGIVTVVTTSATYLTWIAALISGSATSGALIGGTFGLVRAAWLLSVLRVRDLDSFPAVESLLHRWSEPVRRASELAQGTVALALVIFLTRR